MPARAFLSHLCESPINCSANRDGVLEFGYGVFLQMWRSCALAERFLKWNSLHMGPALVRFIHENEFPYTTTRLV